MTQKTGMPYEAWRISFQSSEQAARAAFSMAAQAQKLLAAQQTPVVPESQKHQNQSINIFGPAGSGKTCNAQALAQAFGLSYVFDEAMPYHRIPYQATLVLSRAPIKRMPHINIKAALAVLGNTSPHVPACAPVQLLDATQAAELVAQQKAMQVPKPLRIVGECGPELEFGGAAA